MHQGRQWTRTLRTPTVLEWEYLRMDDKTIDGMILSSLLRNVRRGPVCESFEAKLHAPCMTAMISGPRYGSTSELQVRRTQPNLAHEDNTRRPSHYSPNGRRKCAHIRRKALPDSAYRVFVLGIVVEARCYTERSMTTHLGELCANDGKFHYAFSGLL